MEINKSKQVREIQNQYQKQVSNEIKNKNQRINKLRKNNEHEVQIEKQRLENRLVAEKGSKLSD